MLNVSSGNMYEWVTHTWNPIKGICFHDCSYCFMKKLLGDRMKEIRLEDAEFKTDLGSDNFIFVGSSVDAWAENVPDEWIIKVLDYCDGFNNRYLFQSKNPTRFLEFTEHPVFNKSVFCTTVETNRWYPEVMNSSPKPQDRANAMARMKELGFITYVTAEPLMDFDLEPMVDLLLTCAPSQINIGKNTNWKVKIPEPDAAKAKDLVDVLRGETAIVVKSNAKKWNLNGE